VESKEFAEWIKTQPSYAQSAIGAVLRQGSSAEVIELFDRFKADAAVGAGKAPSTNAASLKALAQAAVEKIGDSVPNSLSDIPGGKAGATGTLEELLMGVSDPTEIVAMMDGLPVEKLNALLNRI
jgi:hypothetical protein